MDNPKLRRLLILLHLYFAAFMAPAFILVAVSGGLYLIGNKGKIETTIVNLPAAASLDFKSDTLEADIRGLLETANIDHDFEYVKNRGNVLQLRPTSRTYLAFKKKDGGVEVTRNDPNFQGSIMELHKGHGPTLFKTYQKLVAIALFFVILGGLLVGLMAKAYRRKTMVATGLGLLVFLFLALVA